MERVPQPGPLHAFYDRIRGLSLMVGNTYGRVIGIIGASLGAIGALLSVGGAYPWWSLAIFAICIYIVHGIFIYSDEQRAPGT